MTFVPGGVSEGIFDLQAFTLSAWIFPKTPLHTAHQTIVKRGSTETMTYRLSLKGEDNKLYLVVTHQYAPTTTTINSDSALTLDQWNHVVGIHDGQQLSLYVNSSPEGSTTTGRALVQGGEKGLDIGGASGTSQNFRGLIDDVQIYNYALSASQVSSLYSTGSF